MNSSATNDFAVEFTQHIAGILDARGFIINHEISEKNIRDHFDAFTQSISDNRLIMNSVIKKKLYYDNLLMLYKNVLNELLDYESDDIDDIARNFVEFEVEVLPGMLNGE